MRIQRECKLCKKHFDKGLVMVGLANYYLCSDCLDSLTMRKSVNTLLGN